MNWQNENERYAHRFDAAKKRWSKSASEVGSPRFVINDSRGWQEVSLVPSNQVWSYVFEENFLGEPKGPTGFLTFGVKRSAQHFLVFDAAWNGDMDNVVLSYRRVCDCRRNLERTRIGDPRPGQCRTCGNRVEWIYPAEKIHRSLPRGRQVLPTTFSLDVLYDPDATEVVLLNAAERGNVYDRQLVARHPNCPSTLLNDRLAADPQAKVREAVAFRSNNGVRREVIAALCEDVAEEIRATMARHSLQVIGQGARVMFASDASPLVRTAIALNSDVPDDMVVTMLQDSGSPECKSLREALSRHPAVDVNSNLNLLTRNFLDLFPNMFYELLSRGDLTPLTLTEIRNNISPEDTRLREKVNSYDASHPGKSRLADSLIENHQSSEAEAVANDDEFESGNED
jgi:hypothetical protein